jgi:hypothetical protein
VVAQHRAERHHSGATAYQQYGRIVCAVPNEVAADRAAQLELIAGLHLIGQVGRHLAVLDALHRQLEPVVFGPRRERVRALRLVAVLRGQTDVDVLPGEVPRPLGQVDNEGLRARRFGADLADRGDLPAEPRQSPQYRCSFHGSP